MARLALNKTSRKTNRAKDREVATIVSSVIGDFTFAIDASLIKDISEPRPANVDSTVPRIDLAQWFGAQTDAPLQARRALLVQLPGSAYHLVMGTEIRICAVTLGELKQLPQFICGLRQRSAIMGFILREDGSIHCLLDAEKLLQLAAN